MRADTDSFQEFRRALVRLVCSICSRDEFVEIHEFTPRTDFTSFRHRHIDDYGRDGRRIAAAL